MQRPDAIQNCWHFAENSNFRSILRSVKPVCIFLKSFGSIGQWPMHWLFWPKRILKHGKIHMFQISKHVCASSVILSLQLYENVLAQKCVERDCKNMRYTYVFITNLEGENKSWSLSGLKFTMGFHYKYFPPLINPGEVNKRNKTTILIVLKIFPANLLNITVKGKGGEKINVKSKRKNTHDKKSEINGLTISNNQFFDYTNIIYIRRCWQLLCIHISLQYIISSVFYPGSYSKNHFFFV